MAEAEKTAERPENDRNWIFNSPPSRLLNRPQRSCIKWGALNHTVGELPCPFPHQVAVGHVVGVRACLGGLLRDPPRRDVPPRDARARLLARAGQVPVGVEDTPQLVPRLRLQSIT